jgi:hypothetical protein
MLGAAQLFEVIARPIDADKSWIARRIAWHPCVQGFV